MSRIEEAATVVVVGAGPVGKTAALLLASQGTPCTLIERRTAPSDEPKAISIDDEALRAYQTAGVLSAILPIIVPGLGTRYFDADGRPLFLAGSSQSGRFGFPYKNPFAQPDLEQALHRAVMEQPGITTLLEHELVDLEQDDDGVDLELRTVAGDARTLRASYVLGADGGRSAVRRLSGIPMSGRSLRESWIVIDTIGDPHVERYGLHYGTPARPHVIVPGLADRCRYEFRLFDGEGSAGEAPSFELIAQLLQPYRSIAPDEVERAVVYEFHALNAQTYQAGRAFVLGDAAHMMPPFAGQGLNSGIRDAVNLCWKISGAVNGRLNREVLSSYTEERRPHAGAMVRLSERLGTIVMATDERVARHRDRLVRAALEDPEKLAWFEGMKYRPATKLESGLIDGEHRLTGIQLNQPRVFDVTAGRIAPLDECLGAGWSILGIDVGPDDWERVDSVDATPGLRRVHAQLDDTMPRGLEVDALIVDIDGGLIRALDSPVSSGRFLLVRPDRFVAASWGADEAVAGLKRIRRWFRASTLAAAHAS